MRSPSILRQPLWLAVAAVLVAAILIPRPAVAVTPESKQVKEMVKKALGYLSGQKEERLGGDCLIGLCFKKAEVDDSPKIKLAVDRCYSSADAYNGDNYSLGIALMFLCEVDPQKHHDVIEKYTKILMGRQQSWGSWGYSGYTTGDTSQTQYGVLGIWMAKNAANIEIPVDKMEGVMGWLMRTQDISGGYGYQGKDPGAHVGRVQQTPVTPTLSASGGGSAYIMADLLQVTERAKSPEVQRSKALQQVVDPSKKDPRGPLVVTLNPADIKETLAAIDRNLGTSYAPVDKWNHYYMYALERYHSFRVLAGGAPDNKWYDAGVAHLAQTQKKDGSWEGDDNPVIATSLATLFLLRSSQKILVKLKMGDGVLRGGNGLPPDVRSIQVDKDGRVVDPGIVIPTEQILELLESGTNPELDRLSESNDPLKLSENPSERDSQIEKLRKKVSAADYESRKIAINTLSRDRNMDNVPMLLYALTDPDKRIVLQADRGLRFISRKVRGVGLPESEPSDLQIKAAQVAWKTWYLSLRPNAELLD